MDEHQDDGSRSQRIKVSRAEIQRIKQLASAAESIKGRILAHPDLNALVAPLHRPGKQRHPLSEELNLQAADPVLVQRLVFHVVIYLHLRSAPKLPRESAQSNSAKAGEMVDVPVVEDASPQEIDWLNEIAAWARSRTADEHIELPLPKVRIGDGKIAVDRLLPKIPLNSFAVRLAAESLA